MFNDNATNILAVVVAVVGVAAAGTYGYMRHTKDCKDVAGETITVPDTFPETYPLMVLSPKWADAIQKLVPADNERLRTVLVSVAYSTLLGGDGFAWRKWVSEQTWLPETFKQKAYLWGNEIANEPLMWRVNAMMETLSVWLHKYARVNEFTSSLLLKSNSYAWTLRTVQRLMRSQTDTPFEYLKAIEFAIETFGADYSVNDFGWVRNPSDLTDHLQNLGIPEEDRLDLHGILVK